LKRIPSKPVPNLARRLAALRRRQIQEQRHDHRLGAFGTLWRQPALTVYVAQKRYTHDFMEQAKYFTVMQFDRESKDKVLEYMGHNSGRDGDKAQALGLTTVYTENGTPYYAEADVVIECEVMYDAPFQESGFKNEVPRETYANFDAGIHSQYIGRVVKAWKKQ